MWFWLFVIILGISIGCIWLGSWMYNHTKYDTEWLSATGWIIFVIAALVVAIMGIFICVQHTAVDSYIAENKQRYESLVYQLENNLYDNDNDLGKKELYNQIQDWNEDLAYYQNVQDDLWVGIFYPNVFDQFEYIEFGGNKS